MTPGPLDSEIVREGDAGLTGFRSRPDALTLPAGVCAYAKNMRFNRGRPEVRKGALRLASEINTGVVPLILPFQLAVDQVPDEDPLTLDFTLPTPVAVVGITRSVSTATVEVTGHGLATGRRVNIRGAVEPEYNGDFTITVTDADHFTYPLVGFPDTPATGTLTMCVDPVVRNSYPHITRVGLTVTVHLAGHGLASGRQINVRGAEQAEYNGDFLITRLDDDTFTFPIVGGNPMSPASGAIVINAGPVVRNDYAGGILAAGVFSSPKSPETGFGKEYIVLVGTDAAYLWRQGEAIVQKDFPEGQTVEPDDEVQVLQAFDQLFVLRSKRLDGEWIPQAVTGITQTGGTATVEFPVAHGLTTADRVAIEGAEQAGYLHEFAVDDVPDSTHIEVLVDAATVTPATGTITVRKVRPPLVWDGGSGDFVVPAGGQGAAGATYDTMRSTSIACYFNNQIVLAPTPGKDTLVVSDVLDYNNYDAAQKSFRCNAGSADRVVAVHPFAEGDVMTFMRSSIYRAHIVIASDGITFDAAQSFIELLTNEVGCRAKRTVVTAGPYIYFLADQGVYRMDLNYSDYKVRGMQVPLSDWVTDLLEQVNDEAMGQSCAAWFDNKYWLAVPVGNSDLPNCILVWNALNNEWESHDIYPTGLHHLLVSDYDGKRRLFAASRSGTLFLLDEQEDGDDSNEGMLQPIPADLITRAYWLNDNGPKRYLRMVATVDLNAGSAVTVEAILKEPDQTVAMGTQSNRSGATKDYSLKLPVRRKGHSLQFKFSNTTPGRWTLRNVAVEVSADRPSLTGRTVT